MEPYFYNVCDGVLGAETNCERMGWSFGIPPKPSPRAEIEDCRIVIRFWEDPLREASKDLGRLEKYHYWRCAPDRDEIYYERIFYGGFKLRLMMRGILSGRPELFANKSFVKYFNFRFNNLHSPNYHLTDLACALLLRDGLCPLHCSGFSVGDRAVAVIAPPDTGKTLTTMHAVLKHGANFISEDLAIIDGTNIYACPWTSTFRYYDELSMSRRMKLRMRLIRIFPPFELLPPPGGFKKIDEYVPKERITSKANVTHLAILARRAGGVKVLDKDVARQLTWNLNRYEFVYMKNPMLTAYSYFNPEFNVRELVAREGELLSQLVDHAECLLVQSTDPTQFARLILEHLDA